MKAKYLILTLIALATTVLSCQQPERDLSLPSIEINKNSAAVDMPMSSFTMMVLTNRAWKATADVPWIAIDPAKGNGDPYGQTITITVLENTSFTRSGHVTFDNVYDSATMTVDQAGKGNPEDYIIFYNDFDKEVATQSYGSGGNSWPYLDQFDGWKNEKGVGVSDVAYDFANVSARANSMSNASYSDYPGSGGSNLLFATNGFIAVKNLSLKEFKNFRLSFGTEKYDNNDKTALFNPAELPVYLSVDGAKWVPLTYAYLGTAAGRWNIAEASFSVPSDVTTLSIYVQSKFNGSAYRVDDLKLEVVEEAGPVVDFSNGIDLPTGGEGGGGGGDTPEGASGTGTLEDPYNPAGAIAAASKLTWTSNTDYQTTETVYVKGKISRIANNGTYGQSGTYGNASFYISADGTQKDEFYCFRILYLGNVVYTTGPDIEVGMEVTVCGQLMNYQGKTPETVAGKAYLYAMEGQGGGGGEGGGGATGSGTQADPYTVQGALAAVKDLTWTSNTDYQSTEEVYVKGKISRIADKGTYTEGGTYGNASFYISDDGTQNNEFYCFRILYLGNKKFAEGDTDIKVGDEVVICGKLMNYKGNTPETVSGKAYLYALNPNGGGGSSSTGSGTQADPYTVQGALAAVKDLTWTSNTDYQSTEEVYVKGKISRIADKGTYTEGGTYGNASFYISDDGAEKDEFYCFRILYLGNKKFAEGDTDIKVGDEVVICGKLMNYKGNTPETVSGKAYLYSLVSGGSTPGGEGGGGGEATTITWDTISASAQTWATATSPTYGTGFSATAQGMTVGYYKSTSTSNPVAPSSTSDHIRVYKYSHLSISVAGKRITGVELTCTPDAGSTSYCFDLSVDGASNAVADKSALKISWSGDVATFEANAVNGQVRIKQIKVTCK